MSEPVWHKPAWVTAIVGVISAFLTIPGVIGDYLSKKQDIELQKERTTEARLENEFRIVDSTLAQQGPERVFVLRYLAATVDDNEARGWAQQEVIRLDQLVVVREELTRARKEVAKKQSDLDSLLEAGLETDALSTEIVSLRSELNVKNTELSIMQANAGFGGGGYAAYGGGLSLIQHIESRLKKMISEQLGLSDEQFAWDGDFTEDLGGDGLDFVEIVMEAENMFQVEIPDEHAERINTPRELASYIILRARVAWPTR